MKYMTKVYLSRWIAVVVALAALGATLLLQRMVFTVTLAATPSTMILAMVFTGAAFGLSWVICSLWKSNRDTMVHEMGIVELKVQEAVIKQAILARESEERSHG
jgi:hypothetical protein